jgi:hypothetical protein
MKLFGIKPSVKSTPILAFHPAITNILICSKDFFGVDFVLEPGAASTSEQEQKNTFIIVVLVTAEGLIGFQEMSLRIPPGNP